MPIVKSSCPLDCPDACSLDVEVEGGRLVGVDGNRTNPLTEGFICGKVRNIADHVHGGDRILYPAIREGKKGAGRFRRARWDEALDLVAARLGAIRARSGGEAILPCFYGGSNGFLTQGTTDARFFSRLGASTLLRTLCAMPSGRAATGQTGKMPGVALTDFVHARLIVIWGMNPSASGIHLVPILKEARRRGAKLVVIDPRAIPVARNADLHLAIRPGTDLPVALAIANRLFESGAADHAFLERHTTGAEEFRKRAARWPLAEAARVAGVEVAALESLVQLYATTHPAVIRCGWGPERNRNGGSAIAAILALPAVAGKFGVRGGGYLMSNSGAWKFDGSEIAGGPAPKTREVNMSRLGEALLELRAPAIESLFVYNSNPLSTAPNQEQVRRGLEREDLFTVVHDQVMTDTARYADVVLPATTFLEHEDLARGYGAMVLQRSRAVIDRVGEARPNYEVFTDLAARMGLARDGDLDEPEAMTDALLRSVADGPRLAEELRERGAAYPTTGNTPVQFLDSFPLTADRRMHLCPEELDREAPGGLYTFLEDGTDRRQPLALISPADARMISSTFGQLVKGPVAIEVHPDDAAARGLRDGDNVRVFNDLGEVHCPVRINPDLRPGVASLPKGLWARHSLNGRTANALAPDHLSDLGGGACFNDARVEIAAAAPRFGLGDKNVAAP